jgi:hypothetical protein
MIVWPSAHSHAMSSLTASSFLLNGRTLTVTKIFSSLALELPPGVGGLELPPGVVGLELPPGVGVDIGVRSTLDAGVLGGFDAPIWIRNWSNKTQASLCAFY